MNSSSIIDRKKQMKKYLSVIFVECIIWIIWIIRNGISAELHRPEIRDQIVQFKMIEFTVGLTYLLVIIHVFWVLDKYLKFKWFLISICVLTIVFASFYMFYIDTFSNILLGLNLTPNLDSLKKSLVGNIILMILVSFSYLAATIYWEYSYGRIKNQHLENENKALEAARQESRKKEYDYDDRVFIKETKKATFVDIKDIKCICAEGNYSKLLFLDNESILVLRNLKSWEAALPFKHFIRIHHSTIININYVKNIENWFKNNYRVYIKGLDTPFEISRRKLSKLQSSLN
jgi:hypothetical protein